MINLNIQKTYRNAYAKKPGVQSDSGALNNIKQDTVSFNGWFKKTSPEILVSQEAYQKICDIVNQKDGSQAYHLMTHIKTIVERGFLYNDAEWADMYVRNVSPQDIDKVREILEKCEKSTNEQILVQCFGEWLQTLGKGPLK